MANICTDDHTFKSLFWYLKTHWLSLCILGTMNSLHPPPDRQLRKDRGWVSFITTLHVLIIQELSNECNWNGKKTSNFKSFALLLLKTLSEKNKKEKREIWSHILRTTFRKILDQSAPSITTTQQCEVAPGATHGSCPGTTGPQPISLHPSPPSPQPSLVFMLFWKTHLES